MTELEETVDKLKDLINILMDKVTFKNVNIMGDDGKFTYVVTEADSYNCYPHVHVCVKTDNMSYSGKILNPLYKSLGAVKLNGRYDPKIISYEYIYDCRVSGIVNKRLIDKWLNTYEENILGKSLESNGVKCLFTFMRLNKANRNPRIK